jgi:hypothetical protein
MSASRVCRPESETGHFALDLAREHRRSNTQVTSQGWGRFAAQVLRTKPFEDETAILTKLVEMVNYCDDRSEAFSRGRG